MVTLSQEHWRFMQIGLRYGATLTDSGTIEEMYAARDLGMQIEAR